MRSVLLIWAAMVLWATFFSRGGGIEQEWASVPFHSYREVLEGGNPEILRSNLMNVILFVPGGAFDGIKIVCAVNFLLD